MNINIGFILTAFLIFVNFYNFGFAQSYKVDSPGQLLSAVEKTISLIKDEKNRNAYIEAVAIVAAYNYETKKNDFYKVFNSKKPKDIVLIAKNLSAILKGRLNGNDEDKRRQAALTNFNAATCVKIFAERSNQEQLNKSMQNLSITDLKLDFNDVRPKASFVVKNNFKKTVKNILLNFEGVDEKSGKVVAKDKSPVGLGSLLKKGEERKLDITFTYESQFAKLKSAKGIKLCAVAARIVFKNEKYLEFKELKNPFDFASFEGFEMQ